MCGSISQYSNLFKDMTFYVPHSKITICVFTFHQNHYVLYTVLYCTANLCSDLKALMNTERVYTVQLTVVTKLF